MRPPLQSATWNPLLSDRVLQTLHRCKGPFRKLGVRLALERLGGASGGLRRAVAKLPVVSSYLEKQFLNFQKTFEQLSDASRDLIVHGQKVATMASGREMGDLSFDQVFALLEGPLDYLGSAQIGMEELVVGLRASVEAISRLIEIERGLEATVAPLQITQVMFRIQAAYLPSEHRQVFNSVTDEIGTLQKQIQSAFNEHVRVLTGLRENLLAVVEALERQMATQGRKVREKREALSLCLAALTEDIKHNADRDVSLTAAAGDLGQKINGAVVTLQTQDMLAQKLEHARSGIDEVVKELGASAEGKETEWITRVAVMTRVEVAQLDGVVVELKSSDTSLQQSFGGIASLLEKLNGDTLMLKEFGEMTASASGSVQALLESLDEIREMLATTVETAKMAEASVLPVRTATEGLTSTVQGVAHEMHLIALNAQIQSIQMGEGTGLDVLAAHSTEVSRATTRISIEAASKVAEVASAVAQQSDRLIALREAGERQQAGLESKGKVQEAALHRFRDQTLEEFGAAGDALDRARNLGATIMTMLNLTPALGDINLVRDAASELQRESEALAKVFGASESGAAEIAGSLARKYTMASERKVQAESLGQHVAAAQVDAVELWDDEPAAALLEPAAEAAEESAAGETVAAAAGEFGEHVELF